MGLPLPKLDIDDNPYKIDPNNLPAGTVVSRQIIWDKDGNPRPALVPMLSKHALSTLAQVALSLPANQVEELDCEDTNISVAEKAFLQTAAKATKDQGSKEHFQFLLDYAIGKPTQKVESTNMSMTLDQYLESLDPNQKIKTVSNDD